MRKPAIGLALAALAALFVFVFAQRQIGQWLFDRGVARNVAVDRVAEWPDGLYAYICGSGSPMPDPQRAGPCIAVIAGQRAFIFDAGSGGIRKLQPIAFPMDRLDAVFLTHLHSDHFDSMGDLMLQAWIAGQRTTPLPVYGPRGVDQVVNGFVDAYRIDSTFRIAHHGPDIARPSGYGAQAQTLVLPSDKAAIVYRGDGATISAIAVDHSPVSPAFAYRIDYGGRSIVISGDTKQSPRLAQFAKGADVLLHEALNPEMVASIGQMASDRGNAAAAAIMSDIPDYHTSPEDAARTAQLAGTQLLVLYHLVPAPPVALIAPAFLGDAKRLFDGRLELGKDGMLIGLPARSRLVEIDQLL